jgi:phospholipid/cholesterol/gamma-HCH transport system permease protein
VALSLARELSPVLTGLMVTARVGASFAAELATMRVTEQIDAMYTLSTNSIKFLIAPRVFASILCLPMLVLVSDIIGIMGGYIVGVYKLSFNSANYINNTIKHLNTSDVTSGLIKALAFGVIISCASCYFGYTAKKGAKGVGIASTNAVVSSSILILLSNYLITQLLFD